MLSPGARGAASRMTSKDPYGAEVEAERITPREGAAAAPKLALFGASPSDHARIVSTSHTSRGALVTEMPLEPEHMPRRMPSCGMVRGGGQLRGSSTEGRSAWSETRLRSPPRSRPMFRPPS